MMAGEIVLSRERRLEDGPAHGRGGAGVGGKQAGRDRRIIFAGQTIHRGQAMLDRFLEIGHLFQGCRPSGFGDPSDSSFINRIRSVATIRNSGCPLVEKLKRVVNWHC